MATGAASAATLRQRQNKKTLLKPLPIPPPPAKDDLQLAYVESAIAQGSWAAWVNNHGWHLRNFTTDMWFQGTIYIVIIVNIIQLGVEVDMAVAEHGPSESASEMLRALEVIATMIFVFELLAKVFFITVPLYFSRGRNWMDSFIVLLSLGDLILVSSEKDMEISYFTVLQIIRILRLLRVVKLVHTFKGMRRRLESRKGHRHAS